VLNQLKRDRIYTPAQEEFQDREHPGAVPHRRLTQREFHLVKEEHDRICTVVDPVIEATVDKLRGVLGSIVPTDSPIDLEVREAVMAQLQELKDPGAFVYDLLFPLMYEALIAGFLAGEREGFRLACATVSSALVGRNLSSAPARGTAPFGTVPQFMAAMVAAMGDDAAADWLIGHLVTGQEPEYIKGTTSPVDGEAGV
jgi:hypothetical protein